MPTFLVNRKVDGLIFMGEISRRYLATAVQTGVPFMLLDFYDDAIAADCVLSDNTSGSYTMTEHLISTGGGTSALLAACCPPVPSWTGIWAT